MRIEVPAMRTFNRSRRIVLAEKETLNFPFLQRQQYAPKAGHTVSVGLRKIDGLVNLRHATFGVPSIQDAAGDIQEQADKVPHRSLSVDFRCSQEMFL